MTSRVFTLGRWQRIVSVALITALVIVGALVAWVLFRAVNVANEIEEEMREISLVSEMDAAFHDESELVQQLVTQSRLGRGTGNEAGQPIGATEEGHQPPSGPQPDLVDHGLAAATAAFEAAASELQLMVGSEADLLGQLAAGHDAFLEAAEEIHDTVHNGGDVVGVAQASLQPVVQQVTDAFLALRQGQNAEISEELEEAGLGTLLSREVPALLLLALLIAMASYKLRLAVRHQLDDLRKVNSAKTELIATVSHELRTPLTAVVGFTEMLRDGSQLSQAERKEMIETIAEQGFEVAGIVEDLLVAARAELGELKVSQVGVDLRAQTAQLLESWHRPEEIPVETAGEAVIAQGDPMRVRQILRNLLTNADRHGGRQIRVEITRKGETSAAISVRDKGVAISKADQRRMFRPFESLNDERGMPGSIGVGLSVSRQLARLMGGDLTYRHENGDNIFELSLQAAPSLHRAIEAEARPILA